MFSELWKKIFFMAMAFVILLPPYLYPGIVKISAQPPYHFFKNYCLSFSKRQPNAIGLSELFYILPRSNMYGAYTWVCGNVGKNIQKEIVIKDNFPFDFDCIYFNIVPLKTGYDKKTADLIKVTLRYDNEVELPMNKGDLLRDCTEGYEIPYSDNNWESRDFVIKNLPEGYAVQLYFVDTINNKYEPEHLKHSFHTIGFNGLIIRHHPGRIIYIQSIKLAGFLFVPFFWCCDRKEDRI